MSEVVNPKIWDLNFRDLKFSASGIIDIVINKSI